MVVPNNIITSSDMMNYLESFFNHSSGMNDITIGMCAGCNEIYSWVNDFIRTHMEFQDILYVFGCQDQLGYVKRALRNVVFWADLFIDTPYDTKTVNYFDEKTLYNQVLNTHLLSRYRLVIIVEAHLIPYDALKLLRESNVVKTISIVDPFDIGGEPFSKVPTVTDTLIPVPQTIAYARHLFGVNTRYINKNMSNNISYVKRISKRTAGKIDSNQYISNNIDFVDEIRQKQLKNQFRKNQKIISCCNTTNMTSNEIGETMSFPKYAIGIIQNTPDKCKMMEVRIHSTKQPYYNIFTYNENDIHGILVKPANIITTEESSHHKFKNAVLITDDGISRREMYTIFKNNMHVTIGNM